MTQFKEHLKHDAVSRRARSRRCAVDHYSMLKHVKALGKMGFFRDGRLLSLSKTSREFSHSCRLQMREFSSSADGWLCTHSWSFELFGRSFLVFESGYFRRISAVSAGVWMPRNLLISDWAWRYISTRLFQGSTDSAHAFPAGMMEVFDGMVYVSVLIWIDDVLLFAKTPKTIFKSWNNMSSACGNLMSSWILTRQIYVLVKSRGVEKRSLKSWNSIWW